MTLISRFLRSLAAVAIVALLLWAAILFAVRSLST